MPETARILRFPARPEAPLSASAVLEASREYVRRLGDEGAVARRAALLGRPDVLLSVCAILREAVDGRAQDVCDEAVALYRSIIASEDTLGSFDEKDYFLGDAAFIAAMASRVLGKRSDAELWLDRSEAGFRHTVNPTPLLANVTYQRLALKCEEGRYAEVIEFAPMLAASYAKLGMLREKGKCLLLEGLALKQSGAHEAAIAKFEALNERYLVETDPGLVGLAMATLADIHAAAGRDDQVDAAYRLALPLLKQAKRPAALAHLYSVVGETLRRQGRLKAAIRAYSASVESYNSLGMRTWVAYLRVVLAQALIEAGQPREAEWQILAALPTIEAERMVPEGFAAVALLRESIRQRKADPAALLELREYLQAKN